MSAARATGLLQMARKLAVEIVRALCLLFLVILVCALLLILVVVVALPYVIAAGSMLFWLVSIRQVGETLFNLYVPTAPIYIAIIPGIVVVACLAILPMEILQRFRPQSGMVLLGLLASSFLAAGLVGQALCRLAALSPALLTQAIPPACTLLGLLLLAFNRRANNRPSNILGRKT